MSLLFAVVLLASASFAQSSTPLPDPATFTRGPIGVSLGVGTALSDLASAPGPAVHASFAYAMTSRFGLSLAVAGTVLPASSAAYEASGFQPPAGFRASRQDRRHMHLTAGPVVRLRTRNPEMDFFLRGGVSTLHRTEDRHASFDASDTQEALIVRSDASTAAAWSVGGTLRFDISHRLAIHVTTEAVRAQHRLAHRAHYAVGDVHIPVGASASDVALRDLVIAAGLTLRR